MFYDDWYFLLTIDDKREDLLSIDFAVLCNWTQLRVTSRKSDYQSHLASIGPVDRNLMQEILGEK